MLGELHLDAADITRRRSDLPQKWSAFPRSQLLLTGLGGPLGQFVATLILKRDHQSRYSYRTRGVVDYVALHLEYILATLGGPVVVHAFEGKTVRAYSHTEQGIEASGAR